MNTVIIQGSSRSDGNTSEIVKLMAAFLKCDVIDLKQYTIEPYNYDHHYSANNEFIPIMEKIIRYDTIIFATPVYWDTMIGLMKTFFDRIADCLKVNKEIGYGLRKLKTGVVSVGSQSSISNCFYKPFINASNYLGINYIGHTHSWKEAQSISMEALENLSMFEKKLTK